MQGVSKRFCRVAAVLAVSSVLIAQGAFASARQSDRGGFDPFARLKQVVVKIFSEFSWPPG
jgi:hypothetical protein